MKKQNLGGLLVGLYLGLGAIAAGAQTILPYGDSVTTFGADPESSYRYWLYQKLTDAGFSFLFVGTRNGVENGSPANSWPQERYSGHEGWTSSDAVYGPNLSAVTSLAPDIVLLDFGSNDILEGFDLNTTTVTNLETIIQAFAAAKPSVTILIAVPTGFVVDPTLPRKQQGQERSQQSRLAGVVNKVVKAEKKAGIKVIKVNQFGGFNPRKDTIDGAHPNVQGEQKIANKYFQALKKIL
ncbi:MAG TPA: GDSL-type esterase/lipase family protein [Verrucomicrobiae bacterium]|nr:GDSL-type esterase/lipase family protein [Verrucomicrobiae bacterium]